MTYNFIQTARLIFVALILCLGLSGFASAQDITSAINGTVRDSSGAVVAGASVTITDPAKKDLVVRTLTTNDDGQYNAPNLAVGVYQITVEAANFKKSVQSNVKIDVGDRRTVDVTLEAGNISEVVTVEADPVSVNLTTATAATTINGDQVRELSVNNRNFVQLVTLAPGVSNDLADQVFVGTTNPDGQANTVNISVNGARSSQNTFTIDGSDVTDRGSNITIQAYPSIDSIGEFKVLRSLYPAESGNSGGGQVNVVTRSGTDSFHGSLFEFVRNEKFNANSFLNNAVTNPPLGRESNGKAKRAPLRYNNFGFTVGGPVFGPNFGEGGSDGFFRRYNKTYFFFSEEQRRDLRYPTFTSTVPDANLRNGIFPINVCLDRITVSTPPPCTNVLTAGTPIPTALYSPTALAYLNQIYKKLPLPNAATAAAPYNLTSVFVNKSNFRQEIVKIDHSFTKNLSAFYRYERDAIPTLDANSLFSSGAGLPGVATTQTDSPGRTHTAQVTYVLSPQTIVEARYAYAYGAILSQNIGLLSNQVTSIPINLPFANTRDRITSVSGNGFSGLVGFGPYDNFSNKHNIGGSISTIFGNHTMKFGANYSKYRKNENALIGDTTGANQGIFTAFATNLPTGVTASTLNQNLQRFANFLVGNASTFIQGKFDYTADLRQSNVEAYAQDEWRFRPNLTLYYGVRYSRFGQPYDKNGRLTNFVPELYNAASAPQVNGNGVRIAGTGNFCTGLIINSQNFQTQPNCTPTVSPWGQEITRTSNRDFAPRVGLAWDPFGKGRTVIRTGYGIYHEQVLVGFAEQIIGLNPPYQFNVTVSNTSLDNPSTNDQPFPLSIRAIDPNWETPYMQHWSLDFQHQLSKNTVFSVGYYGSKGTHLVGIVELNEVPPGNALNSFCATGTNTLQSPGAGGLVRCQTAGTAFFTTGASTILDQIRPYKNFRSITMLKPIFNSNYHSLQAFIQHRFARESQINASYTFSKNLTNSQNDRTNAPQNSYNIAGERSRAALDRRHIFTMNYIYELPFFSKQQGLTGKLLGGYQFSGIITLNSGLPFTATTSAFDPAGLGFIPALVAGGRPNVLCDPNENAPHTLQQYFNTSCFQVNPASTTTSGISNTVGNAGRGIIDGPATRRVDFTLTKNIRFGETMRLQLRGEAFNVFNWTNFRSFNTNITNPNGAIFGAVNAVRDPRTIQLGIKFYF